MPKFKLKFGLLCLCLCLASLETLAATGVLLRKPWVFPTERQFRSRPIERTQPLVVGDVVYVGRLNGDLLALHRTDGYVLWQKKLPAGIEGSLTYARSKLFVGDLAGNLYALNARDGSEIWHFKIGAEWLSPVAVAREKLIAVSGTGEVYALLETQGTEAWHFSRPGDEKMTVRGSGAPVIFGGTDVVIGFSDGHVVSLALADGKSNWVKRLRTRDRFYDVDSTPYVDEKIVIAATFDGRVYALNRLNGEIEWIFNTGAYAGFLVENDLLYFAGLDNHFHAVDKNTGAEKWKIPYEGKVGTTPVRVGQYLVLTTVADPMLLIDPEMKRVEASIDLGAGSLAPVGAYSDGWFYCLSNYGNVYAYEIAEGSRKSLVNDILRTPSDSRPL